MMKQTQYAKIIAWCKAHGSITVRDMVAIGINSPTMRIAEMLRKECYQVETETVKVYGDDGKLATHYTRYFVSEVAGIG